VFNITAFCKDYNISYSLQGKNISPGWVGLQCPFHADTSYHLGFNAQGGYFYCWKCGSHHTSRIIQELLHCTLYDAYSIIEEYNTRTVLIEALNKKKPLAETLVLPGEELTKPYRVYLHRRGFDPDDIIAQYKVKAGGIVGDWKYRLMIPVYHNHRLVTYQGRDITGNTDLRYKTLAVEKSVENPKHCLYNEDAVPDKKNIIVCEGVMDVWKMGSGAVATLGTSTTEEQVRKLSAYANVYIVFDPEAIAQKRARKLGERISALGANVTVIDTGLDHDPGDMTAKEVETFRKELGV